MNTKSDSQKITATRVSKFRNGGGNVVYLYDPEKKFNHDAYALRFATPDEEQDWEAPLSCPHFGNWEDSTGVSDRLLISLWPHRTYKKTKHGERITEPILLAELEARGYEFNVVHTKKGIKHVWAKKDI